MLISGTGLVSNQDGWMETTLFLSTFGPQNRKKWRVEAPKFCAITSKNEGCGFPWHAFSSNPFETLILTSPCHGTQNPPVKKIGALHNRSHTYPNLSIHFLGCAMFPLYKITSYIFFHVNFPKSLHSRHEKTRRFFGPWKNRLPSTQLTWWWLFFRMGLSSADGSDSGTSAHGSDVDERCGGLQGWGCQP